MGYTKMTISGNTVEISQYERNLPVRRAVRRSDSYKKGTRRFRPRSAESIRRATKAFRRIVWANLVGDEHPALYTFTMLQNLPYEASVRIFSEFVVRLRKREGREFRYIAVPEFQKRGATHWHVLFWGLRIAQPCYGKWKKKGKYSFFIHECPPGRQCERRTRYISRLWLRGFCDGLVTDGHDKLASYLGKYLSKTMRDLRNMGARTRLAGKKAYYTSRNALRPVSVGTHAFSDLLIESTLHVDNLPVQSREFSTQFLGRATYKQFKR